MISYNISVMFKFVGFMIIINTLLLDVYFPLTSQLYLKWMWKPVDNTFLPLYRVVNEIMTKIINILNVIC
jgi:hypothetical protein